MNIRAIEQSLRRKSKVIPDYIKNNIAMPRRSGKTTMLKNKIEMYLNAEPDSNIFLIIPSSKFNGSYERFRTYSHFYYIYDTVYYTPKLMISGLQDAYIFSDEVQDLSKYKESFLQAKYIQGYFTPTGKRYES